MKLLKFCFFLAIMLSGAAWRLAAQEQREQLPYSLQHFTDEDGLPQNSVKNIITDSLGFVWFVTENGLVRFDGHQFEIYNKTNIPHLKSNRFAHIRRIERYKIFAVSDFNEYIQIKNGRAFYPEMEKNIVQYFRDVASDDATTKLRMPATGLPPRYELNLTKEDCCLIRIGIDSFIKCFSDRIVFLYGKQLPKTIAADFREKKLSNYFRCKRRLYYFDSSGDIAHITEHRIKPVKFTGDLLDDPRFLASRKGFKVYWDNVGYTVLIYFNRNFYFIRDTSANGDLQTELIFKGFDIEDKRIITHYYDKPHKRLFLGSDVNGFYILSRKDFVTVSDNSHGNTNVYYSHIPFGPGSVLTPQGSVMSKDRIVRKALDSRESGFVNSTTMLRDYQGFLWLKDGRYLLRSDSNFRNLDSWKLDGDLSCLFQAEDSVLWLGVKNAGLYKMNGSPQLVTKTPDITFIEGDRKGNIWVATISGLYCYNKNENSLSEMPGLKGKYVRSICIVSDDEVWITTYEDGIYLYQQNKLIAMPRDKNNFLSTAHCIVPDQHGFLWITTNKGLFQASRADMLAFAQKRQEDVYYVYYGKSRGFNTNEFNGGCEPCGLLLNNGYISLPSLDGLVWFNPSNIITDLPDKPLIIDKIIVDRKHEFTASDSINLPRGFDQVKIFISTVYFGDKKNIQIFYSIKECGSKEENWRPMESENAIAISNLPSGNYQLRIRKLNGFGKNNFTEIDTTLIVPFAFYETMWFKILMLLLLGVLIYVYIKLRIWYVMRSNRQLELQVARRTRNLQHTLRALESSEWKLRRQTQIQEMLIAAISHDIKSPMKYLLLAAQKMKHFVSRKDYDNLPVFNNAIEETASKVYNILDNLLKYISLQLKTGEVKMEELDLKGIVAEKVGVFTGIAAVNSTIIINEVGEGSTVFSKKELFAVIIHNLIDNSVKYTANGVVKISFERTKEFSALIIEDTGTGIDQELLDWLNAQSKGMQIEIDTASGHKGMGLIIVKELLSAIDALIEVSSTPLEGTKVRIKFYSKIRIPLTN